MVIIFSLFSINYHDPLDIFKKINFLWYKRLILEQTHFTIILTKVNIWRFLVLNKKIFKNLTVGILSLGIIGSSFVIGGTKEAEAASTNYIRGYSCNGKTVATGDKNKTEAEAYNWIISNYNKGYVQAGQSGGTTLGVVLNDTKIDFSSSSYNAVSVGSTGSYVKAVQATLKCIGYPVAVDGIFGKETQSAIKAFQTKKGLTSDGVVGRQTYHYLSFSQ